MEQVGKSVATDQSRKLDEMFQEIQDLKATVKEIDVLKIEIRKLKNQVEKQKWALKQLESGTVIPSLKNEIETACSTKDWNKCVKILERNVVDGSAVRKQLDDAKLGTCVPLNAATKGYTELLHLLLNNGLKVNEPLNNRNDTLLHAAARSGKKDVVHLLLSLKPDIDVRNANNNTPLSSAARFGKIKIVTLLVECGANINAIDNDGDTILHNAVLGGHTSIVEYLLRNKCEKLIKNKENKTVVDIALEKQYGDVIKALFHE